MPVTSHAFSARLELDLALDYLLYLPTARPAAAAPLVLFLHGAGERGDDLSLVLTHGLPRLLHEGLDLPAVVVAPQLPAGRLWTHHLAGVRALVDHVVREHGADEDRISVTGLSLGGAGAYEFASIYPDLVSAVAPICGPWTSLFVTDAAARVPTWVLHGAADPVVPVLDSERLVDAIRRHGGEPRFTVFPGVDHNSWDPAYRDTDLLAWLLERRRSERLG